MSFTNESGAMTRRLTILLLLGGALATPAVTGAQAGARGGRVSVQCTDCSPSDSAMRTAWEAQARLAVKFDSLRREFELTRRSDTERELLKREMTETIRALQTALGEAQGVVSAERARVPYAEVRGSGGVAVALRSSTPTRGYLGVSFEGMSSEFTSDREHVIRFYQYPRIALVEPASPAERAGILQGDTLLALNGVDVLSGEISLTRLLVPSRRLNVRVRRESDAKNLTVTVGLAPEYVVRRTSPPEEYAYAPSVASGTVRAEPAPPRQVRVSPAPGATPSAAGRVWVFNEGVGGARMETVTEGLATALGVGHGVLVVRAAPGTPAHESGLRDGDVIQRVGDRRVSTVSELRAALLPWGGGARGGNTSAATVVIVRERKTREVTLRW
ncbi:MAG: PDZ domain-containing protein [Gemmatimonadaceae bacterium]